MRKMAVNLAVREPGANPLKRIELIEDEKYPIYPCKTRKLTGLERRKYGLED
jgi:hypothetical protein